MKEKWMYLIIGVVAATVMAVCFEKGAVQPALSESKTEKSVPVTAEPIKLPASANGMVIQSINTTFNETILLVLDTANKKLLVYEYDKSRNIVFKAFRDIQYDLTFPDGGSGIVTEPLNAKNLSLAPLDIKKWFEDWQKTINKDKEKK